MRQKDLRGRNEAFIDMGLSNLLAVAVSSGLGILVKGGVIKSEHFYW